MASCHRICPMKHGPSIGADASSVCEIRAPGAAGAVVSCMGIAPLVTGAVITAVLVMIMAAVIVRKEFMVCLSGVGSLAGTLVPSRLEPLAPRLTGLDG